MMLLNLGSWRFAGGGYRFLNSRLIIRNGTFVLLIFHHQYSTNYFISSFENKGINKCKLRSPFKHDSRCALFSLLSFVTTNSTPQREAQRMSYLKGVQRLPLSFGRFWKEVPSLWARPYLLTWVIGQIHYNLKCPIKRNCWNIQASLRVMVQAYLIK